MRIVATNGLQENTVEVYLYQLGDDEVQLRTRDGWALLTLSGVDDKVKLVLHTGLPPRQFEVDDRGQLRPHVGLGDF